jgi:8-amino-7-oxononanoate synthase
MYTRTIKDIEKKDSKYVWVGGEKLLNLSSNNYLGLADNPTVVERFLASGGADYSLGSASARLLTGTLPVYKELEELITSLFQPSTINHQLSTLLFNSGYHANVGMMSGIEADAIFSDKLNHASIIDGAQLSRANFHRYPHNDLAVLERLLQEKTFKNGMIVTESVFSMDGDIADLARLVELKKKYNCTLVVDEAHAFGVFGRQGLGIAQELGLAGEIDLIMGTFGKAIGSYGAFVTGRKDLIDRLINKARPFIFSTALPPINVAFSKWALENELPHTYEKRREMLDLGRKLGGKSQIIPVVAGDKTPELCEKLRAAGYYALPINPPTVPEGTSRVRISLTTEITPEDVEALCSIIG